MARSVTYSVVPRINPREKNDPPKFYAQAQARGDVNLREMAERIQSTCTVTKADVYAVLVSLEDVVKEAIQNGEIVRLGDLCTLQVGLSGKGALTEEDHIIIFILNILQVMFLGKRNQVIGNHLGIPGTVGNGTDLFKITKYVGRLQAGQLDCFHMNALLCIIYFIIFSEE